MINFFSGVSTMLNINSVSVLASEMSVKLINLAFELGYS